MTSGSSSLVILTDEVDHGDMEEDLMTACAKIVTDKSLQSSEPPTIQYKTSISDDNSDVWSDSDDECENHLINKTVEESTDSLNNKDKTITMAKPHLTEEVDDWENWT
nr:SJCHGC03197 protein [Schistosoma japonicum]